MTNQKSPVFLTENQIVLLQSIVLEKQLELATKQSDEIYSGEFRELSEHLSHATDLLLALSDAKEEKPTQHGLLPDQETENPVP